MCVVRAVVMVRIMMVIAKIRAMIGRFRVVVMMVIRLVCTASQVGTMVS